VPESASGRGSSNYPENKAADRMSLRHLPDIARLRRVLCTSVVL
jgi:hypothetical protein